MEPGLLKGKVLPEKLHRDTQILVVEDERDVGETISISLQEEGYVQTRHVFNGDEALSTLSKEQGIRIVITDFKLGSHPDGLKLINRPFH